MASGGAAAAILHVAVVQVLSLTHQLDDLGSELLILSFLNLELALELDKLAIAVLHSLLELSGVLQHGLLLSLKYFFDLPGLFVLLIEGHDKILILVSQLSDGKLLLLETLFNDADLLGVGKGVLRLDDFLELAAKTGALVDVKLHFDLYLSELSRFDVTLQCLNLVLLGRDI